MLTRFVFAWIGGANESVRTLLDGVREFLEILGDAAEIIEKLVDIFGVDVERLIHATGDVGEGGQGFAKLDDGLAHVSAVFSEKLVDMREGFVGFVGSVTQILKKRLQLLAHGVQ